MPASIRLDNAASMHPTIQLSFPRSHLAALQAEECSPSVLLRLPPALFLDHNTFPTSQSLSPVRIKSIRHLNSSVPSLASYDFNRVELEQGVGYSNPSHEGIVGEGGGGEGVADRTRIVRPKANQVKQVGDNKYIVAFAGEEGSDSRFQDEYADAQKPLAKEQRAVLFTLEKEKQRENSRNRAVEVEYDDLTGKSVVQADAEETVIFAIPIHARYVSPRATDLSSGLWKSILLPSAGNYEEVLFDRPELLWMCQRVEYLLDSNQYDKIAPSDLLPSPHSHLSLQFDPPESLWHFWRYKIPSQDTPFKLQLPAGNASLAPLTQIITFAMLFLAATWAVSQTQKILSGIHKKQVQVEKRYSSKSQ